MWRHKTQTAPSLRPTKTYHLLRVGRSGYKHRGRNRPSVHVSIALTSAIAANAGGPFKVEYFELMRCIWVALSISCYYCAGLLVFEHPGLLTPGPNFIELRRKWCLTNVARQKWEGYCRKLYMWYGSLAGNHTLMGRIILTVVLSYLLWLKAALCTWAWTQFSLLLLAVEFCAYGPLRVSSVYSKSRFPR